MSKRYETEARNDTGGSGTSYIVGGMQVPVSSPLDPEFDASASNPEQLLALSWGTCLNATAQAIVKGETRTRVRVTAELHQAESGYEFHVDAYFSAEGADTGETDRLLHAAHARCPVSKLLAAAATVHVHSEPYTA